jgi:putative Mn2+ efflux pump MntP
LSLITIVLIAVALAMDTFAVSITSGATIKKMHLHHALRIALIFGGFQAIMPLAGWSIGRFAETYIQTYDHWVAFALLVFIGGKMIYEASHLKEDYGRSDPLNLYILLMLAFATSIDAAVVGITLSFINIQIVTPVLIIGAVTFLISFTGMYIGKKSGDYFGKKIEIIGGLVLISIGIKIVIEHQFLS